MTVRIALILAGFGLAARAAFAQDAAISPADPTTELAPELKALAEDCSAHKFETLVVVDGSRRGSKVKICGKSGQSDADWLVTLRSSIKQAEGNERLTPPVREQIVAALKAEIARLEAAAAAATVTARDVTIAVADKPVTVPEAAPRYSLVPALPAPKPRAASSAAAQSVPVERPRLTIRCALPNESFAACARLERETRLLIRADQDLAGGTSVRILRGGDERAELDLGPLKRGQSLRERLPTRVCSGVLRGKVQLQILAKNQVAETLGPFALYCGS